MTKILNDYTLRALADGWWICPECGDDGRWRALIRPDVYRCPDCGHNREPDDER